MTIHNPDTQITAMLCFWAIFRYELRQLVTSNVRTHSREVMASGVVAKLSSYVIYGFTTGMDSWL